MLGYLKLGVAQLVSAFALEAKGPTFESWHLDHETKRKENCGRSPLSVYAIGINIF